MALRTFCDHCTKECVGVAYRLDAVHADAPTETLRRPTYLHWECVPLYQRSEEMPGAYHLYDTANGAWWREEGKGWADTRADAHTFTGRQAASLASSLATNTTIVPCKPECGHSGQ